MKTSKFDDLNDAFNVETDIVPAETTKVQKKEVKSNGDHIQKDYEYTRGNLKDVNEEEKSKGPSTVNNALFVGSTSELSKILKSGLNKENK